MAPRNRGSPSGLRVTGRKRLIERDGDKGQVTGAGAPPAYPRCTRVSLHDIVPLGALPSELQVQPEEMTNFIHVFSHEKMATSRGST